MGSRKVRAASGALAVALFAFATQAAPDAQSVAAVKTILDSPKFAAAKTAMQKDHGHFVEQIIQLTEIPAPPFGEAEKGKVFAEMMRQSGFSDVQTDQIGNVIAVRPGKDRTLPALVIAAHIDTVFPAGTDVKVRREGTKLMAPGIGDDTRNLALLLAFERALNAARIETRRDIIFVGDVGEEGPGDLRGVRSLFKDDAQAKGAVGFISFDASGGDTIVTRGVGSRRFHIVFSGPGGHSYGAFGIVNPMVPLAKTVTGLYAIPVPADPKTTYSASVVSGGTSVNTIPHEVALDVDIRSPAPAEVEKVEKALRAVADKAVAEENATRSTARGTVSVRFDLIGDRPAGSTDESKGIAAIAFAASQSFGFKPKYIAVSTDSNIPMSLGIPAITLGSGGKGGAEHAPDEWIDVDEADDLKGMDADLATILAIAGLSP